MVDSLYGGGMVKPTLFDHSFCLLIGADDLWEILIHGYLSHPWIFESSMDECTISLYRFIRLVGTDPPIGIKSMDGIINSLIAPPRS